MQSVIALIHSPLVGPATWEPVRAALRRRGMQAVVPLLADDPASDEPFWQQHATSIARTCRGMPAEQPVVLVGHSGAGPILPAIARAVARPVRAYVFADAGLPVADASRLAMIEREDPVFAERVRAHLESGGRYPEWTVEQLRDHIPVAALREAVASGLRPRDLRFFSEPIPVPDGWPDAPCGYLHFSAAYDAIAREARARGWPVEHLPGGHFHMLVDTLAVVDALLRLSEIAP